MLNFLRKTALWIVLIPALVFGTGVASNQAVLVANHDRFPVMWNSYKAASLALAIEKAAKSDDPDEAEQAAFDLEALHDYGYLDDTHVLMNSKTHLNFLADWIDLKSATYSIGDFLIDAGEWGMTYAPIVWITVAVQRLRKREDY
jgi:hypothetical protein